MEDVRRRAETTLQNRSGNIRASPGKRVLHTLLLRKILSWRRIQILSLGPERERERHDRGRTNEEQQIPGPSPVASQRIGTFQSKIVSKVTLFSRREPVRNTPEQTR